MRGRCGSRCGRGEGNRTVSLQSKSIQSGRAAAERDWSCGGGASLRHRRIFYCLSPGGDASAGEVFVAFAAPIHLSDSEEGQCPRGGASASENICFYTHAALSMMDGQEMEALRADCIILDEFHRCGAKEEYFTKMRNQMA